MHQLDLLVAEPHELHERHVLIRHRDEAGLDHRLVGAAPVASGQLLVLATPGAHEVSSLVAALPALLSDFMAGIESVWVGVGSLAGAGSSVQLLADELGVEVVSPDGGVAAMPGAALYAGHGAGGTGWYSSGEFLGARFPLPEWESWVPAQPVEIAGAVAVPVPCGLMISCDLAFDVPVNQRFPKLVVGGPAPSPAVVAALLGGLPDRPIMVVPATPEAASHIWQAELAMRLSREVVFSAGMQVRTRTGALSTIVPDAEGNRLFRPFPLVLRQNARGGDQQVLDIAAAPPGWVREGRRSYRHTDSGEVAAGGVVADVVPSGLVLRAADGEPVDPAAEAAPFDPEGWTLTLGTSGQVVGLPVLAAAENLLTELPAEQRAVVRVRLAGVMDEEAEHALDRWAAARKRRPAPVDRVSEVDDLRAGRGFVVALPEPTVPLVRPGADVPEAPAPVVVAPPVPPVMTTSGAPVSTVSGSPAPTRQVERGEPERVVPAEPEAVLAESGGPPPVADAVPGEGIPSGENATAVEATPPAQATPPPTRESAARAGNAAGRALAVPARGSTAGEQTRFTAAAGDSFSEALATVNAALATWPSMRVDDSPGAKADYVAVCLFLGRGDGGARSINGALRVGQAGVLEGQVPCLMSGIRRLPTHRRAVLRQGKVNESLEHGSTPGTVLTEPGFLAGSIDLDVTVPGADLDVLIWPSSARRTSELMLGRPIDEAVFVAGARFKALAVRTAEEDDDQEEEEDDGSPVAPRVAVLYRELAPGETPITTELDERDLAVLAKLDSVLARRHEGPLRLVEDLEVAARLTTSMVAWQNEAATAVAS